MLQSLNDIDNAKGQKKMKDEDTKTTRTRKPKEKKGEIIENIMEDSQEQVNANSGN